MAFNARAKAPTYEVSGTVEKISEKDTGKYQQMSLLVNGNWYGKFNASLKDSPVSEGDVINLVVADAGKYKNWESFEIVSKASPAPKASTSGAPPTDNYNLNQFRITYQSARNAAIELAGILLAKDLLPVPTVKSKQVSAVIDFIDEVTKDYVIAAWEATPDLLNQEEEVVKSKEQLQE